jgi:hypothetical protein
VLRRSARLGGCILCMEWQVSLRCSRISLRTLPHLLPKGSYAPAKSSGKSHARRTVCLGRSPFVPRSDGLPNLNSPILELLELPELSDRGVVVRMPVAGLRGRSAIRYAPSGGFVLTSSDRRVPRGGRGW